MADKKQIYQSGDETASAHRGDFETCPHCDHVMSHEKWIRMAKTLCLRPRSIKYGYASILTECPKCFEVSWIHSRLDSISHYHVPKTWIAAAEKEAAAQKLTALRHWGKSLCWKCRLLKSGTIEYSTQRICEKGLGPSEILCSLFK